MRTSLTPKPCRIKRLTNDDATKLPGTGPDSPAAPPLPPSSMSDTTSNNVDAKSVHKEAANRNDAIEAIAHPDKRTLWGSVHSELLDVEQGIVVLQALTMQWRRTSIDDSFLVQAPSFLSSVRSTTTNPRGRSHLHVPAGVLLADMMPTSAPPGTRWTAANLIEANPYDNNPEKNQYPSSPQSQQQQQQQVSKWSFGLPWRGTGHGSGDGATAGLYWTVARHDKHHHHNTTDATTSKLAWTIAARSDDPYARNHHGPF